RPLRLPVERPALGLPDRRWGVQWRSVNFILWLAVERPLGVPRRRCPILERVLRRWTIEIVTASQRTDKLSAQKLTRPLHRLGARNTKLFGQAVQHARSGLRGLQCPL